jgi:hypothetical protein
VLRIRATGAVAGTVQATLRAGGLAAGPAEVAWVVVRAAQGRGHAKEAARSLAAMLQEAGWTVIATSIPVTWPPSGSPTPPGCHPPPVFVTARCAGSGYRPRRLNLGDCAHVNVLNRHGKGRPGPARRAESRYYAAPASTWDHPPPDPR